MNTPETLFLTEAVSSCAKQTPDCKIDEEDTNPKTAGKAKDIPTQGFEWLIHKHPINKSVKAKFNTILPLETLQLLFYGFAVFFQLVALCSEGLQHMLVRMCFLIFCLFVCVFLLYSVLSSLSH